MTKHEWLSNIKQNKDKIDSLISRFHPVRRVSKYPVDGCVITAPNAERACEAVRDNIRKNFEGDPVEEFQLALEAEDTSKCYKIMSDTWFGVPESRDCWNLIGFQEIVDLLDEYLNI
jgi:hypothetical protein